MSNEHVGIRFSVSRTSRDTFLSIQVVVPLFAITDGTYYDSSSNVFTITRDACMKRESMEELCKLVVTMIKTHIEVVVANYRGHPERTTIEEYVRRVGRYPIKGVENMKQALEVPKNPSMVTKRGYYFGDFQL